MTSDENRQYTYLCLQINIPSKMPHYLSKTCTNKAEYSDAWIYQDHYQVSSKPWGLRRSTSATTIAIVAGLGQANLKDPKPL